MKIGYHLVALFLLVGSLYGSMRMEYPIPFFIVAAILGLIYYLRARFSRRKKFEEGYQKYLFQEHMRKMNKR